MANSQSTYSSDLFNRIDREKQNRILTTAVAEFAKCGYENANVNRIADNAGISVGSLYKYFATKNDLYMHIAEEASLTIREYITDILKEETSVFAKMEKLLRAAYGYSLKDPYLIKLYDIFTSDNDDERAEILAEMLEGLTAKAYKELITKARKKGEIRKDIAPEVLAFMLDNQLMATQFAFANKYYGRRLSLFLNTENPGEADVEQMIGNMMKVFRQVLTPGGDK